MATEGVRRELLLASRHADRHELWAVVNKYAETEDPDYAHGLLDALGTAGVRHEFSLMVALAGYLDYNYGQTEPEVRNRAAEACRSRLVGEDMLVLSVAVEGLGFAGEAEQDWDAVEALSRGDDPRVRISAVDAMVLLDSVRTKAALPDLLAREDDVWVRGGLLAHAFMSGVSTDAPDLTRLYNAEPRAARNYLRVVQETLNERTTPGQIQRLIAACLSLKGAGVELPIADDVDPTIELLRSYL